MKNNGAVTGTISAKDEEYTIPQGHHDGSGKVGIAASEKEKLIPDNYLSQVTVEAIPYNESENPAGGTTVTIG